jgi:Ca-activated chloride channel family protein
VSESRRSPVPIIVAVLLGLSLVLAIRLIAGGSSDTSGRANSERPHGQRRPELHSRDGGREQREGRAAQADRRGVLRRRSHGRRPLRPGRRGEQGQRRGRDRAGEGLGRAGRRAPTGRLVAGRVVVDRAAAQQAQRRPSPTSCPPTCRRSRDASGRGHAPADGHTSGWPTKPLGWSDLFALAKDPRGWGSVGHPEWGRFKLGKTNPHYSTSGLNATVATYFAATGRSSDLSAKDVAAAQTRAFVEQIESSVVHYGDTTLTFLSNMAKADAAGRGLTYVSAVTVEEKSVWDYNQGNPTGDPTTLGQGAKPKVPLVAVYPKDGTLLSDNPYVVLTAPWVDEAKKAVAADFLSYVREPERQQRFQARLPAPSRAAR